MQHGLVVQRVQVLGRGRAAQQVHGVLGVVGLGDFDSDGLAAEQNQDQVQENPAINHVAGRCVLSQRKTCRGAVATCVLGGRVH